MNPLLRSGDFTSLSSRLWEIVQRLWAILVYLYKLICVALVSAYVSFLSVLWLWFAVKERNSSSLPNLVNSANFPVLVARYFCILIGINLLYLAWILIRIAR